ncbi:MAG: T9SS type A sorting domain-containing protein [Flavobacteriales bacterium]|nr:T9SS type A sorting domain-containing protein [Flavobacteriales bacterium]
MKKGLLIIGVALCGITYGQQYQPFSEADNTTWVEWTGNGHGFNCCCSGTCVHEENYKLFIDGDTTIGSTIYKKIYRTGSDKDYVSGPATCPQGCTNTPAYVYYENIYQAAIRQDINMKQVFAVNPGQNTETLIYDFNVMVGDTFIPGSDNVVAEIDSVLTNLGYRKRYWLSQGAASKYVAVIEGIGSTYGLLTELVPPFETTWMLNCYVEQDSTIYPDGTLPCDIPTSLTDLHAAEVSLNVFPNPFDKATTIRSSVACSSYRIYSLAGELVRRQEGLSDTNLTIERGSLPTGMYFIEVMSEDGLLGRQRIIIQ